MPKPEFLYGNKRYKILWDFEMHMNQPIPIIKKKQT